MYITLEQWFVYKHQDKYANHKTTTNDKTTANHTTVCNTGLHINIAIFNNY